MRVSTVIRSFVLSLLAVGMLVAQTQQSVMRMAQGKVGASQDELVSFKADVPYTQAIQSLGELSKKFDGKLLIDRSPLAGKDKTIGVNIESMYWKDALELILRNNQVWYNDYPEYREIVSLDQVGRQTQQTPATTPTTTEAAKTPTQAAIQQPYPMQTPTQQAPAPVDSSEYYAKLREITISSVFFEVDQTKLSQLGVAFSIFRGKDLNLGVQFTGTKNISSIFSASVNPTDPRLAVDVNAALGMLESNQAGEVIARPQVTVRSGSTSRIQIGQNFSTLQKDFSGNTVEKFYETGTILTVKPRVFKVGETEFIDLYYQIERSTPQISATSTVVSTTKAEGTLSLLNGEESYVGGMYSNETTTLREGVPLLKDLPWWVLGLRYLFGYDTKSVTRKELIVLIRAQMLPLIKERAEQPLQQNVLQQQRRDNQQDLDRRTTIKKD